MALHHEMTVSASPDRVAELLCSERYSLTQQKAREDCVDARYEAKGETDTHLEFEVHLVSYAHKRTGKLDRNKTENSTTAYRYDKGTRTLYWQHHGNHGDRVDVHGDTKLVDAGGDRTRIVRDVTIDIRVPVVGRAIAKIVETKFRQSFDGVGALIVKLLAEDG
jgi:hypothetical protein